MIDGSSRVATFFHGVIDKFGIFATLISVDLNGRAW
jgi:hypothetical protein